MQTSTHQSAFFQNGSNQPIEGPSNAGQHAIASTNEQLKVLSLFSGIGGFDLAFQCAGFEHLAFCEQDKDCQRVLRRHFPEVEIINDVKLINSTNYPFRPDVICGGFPCQDVSVAGKRRGMAGERSGLWFEFRRIIESYQPRWVVVENVPGLLSSASGEDFYTIVQGLAELRYLGAWRVFDSQFDGVAQRRRRVFIVAGIGAAGERAAEILFERTGGCWDSPPRRETGQDIAGTIRSGAAGRSAGAGQSANGLPGNLIAGFRMTEFGGCADDGTSSALKQRDYKDATDLVVSEVAATLNSGGNNGGFRTEPGAHLIAHTLSANGADASEDGTGRGTPLVAQTITSHQFRSNGATAENNGQPPVNLQVIPFDTTQITSKENGSQPQVGSPCHPLAAGAHAPAIAYNIQQNDGGSHRRQDRPNGGMYVKETDTALTIGSTDQTVVAFTERTRADGRNFEAQEELAYALTNPGSGGRTHSRQIAGQFGVRRLMPVECEALQGFPRDWTAFDAEGKSISDSARYRMLGNAVCVPTVEWIARRIGEAAG